jgi:hypothetical protein
LDRTCFVSLFFIFLCHTSFWNPSMWLHISVFITFYRKVMWTPWKSSCSSTIYLKQSSLLLKIELLWYLSWKLGWVYNRKSILGLYFFHWYICWFLLLVDFYSLAKQCFEVLNLPVPQNVTLVGNMVTTDIIN